MMKKMVVNEEGSDDHDNGCDGTVDGDHSSGDGHCEVYDNNDSGFADSQIAKPKMQ